MPTSKLRFRRLGQVASGIAVLFLAVPASAWNATGHRAIAAIAYERLTPAVRARVDEFLKNHPDYGMLLTTGAPADPEGRARAAFLAAAVWPDTIKGDPRFYDDLRKDVQPTPLIQGFPDMARHTNWHYYDVPYSADGTPPKEAAVPNALTEIRRLMKETSDPSVGATQLSYDLPWIEHIIGDLHQPLHCVSRFLRSQPNGDAGGNFVFVSPGGNLHAFWDDLAGADSSNVYILRYASDAVAAHPPPGDLGENPAFEIDPEVWIHEGFEIAKTDVYAFGPDTGSREAPIRLSAGYQESAKKIAQARIALAGYRLAAVLNALLQ
jgi:hypothetical protein